MTRGSPRRAPWLATVLTVAVCIVAPIEASASPVNAENLRSDTEKAGWSGSVDAKAAFSRGNVDRLDVGYGGGVQFLTLFTEGVGFGRRDAPEDAPRFFRDRWLLLTDGAFGRAADNTFMNRGFVHTRYTRMWLPRVGSDLFLQGQYNQLTRLGYRIVGGLGLRVDAVHRRVIGIWMGSGYMPEYEVNDTVTGDPHPARVVNHRWTSYGVVQLRLFDEGRLVIRDTVYAQPRFDRLADVRVLQHFQMEARVTPVFALGAEFLLQYDSEPPREVVPLDLSLGSYIRLRFQ